MVRRRIEFDWSWIWLGCILDDLFGVSVCSERYDCYGFVVSKWLWSLESASNCVVVDLSKCNSTRIHPKCVMVRRIKKKLLCNWCIGWLFEFSSTQIPNDLLIYSYLAAHDNVIAWLLWCAMIINESNLNALD